MALFEKRMAVYNTTMAFIADVMQTLKPGIAECMEFMRKTRDHEFLFESEIGDFINELYKQGINLETYNAAGPATHANERHEVTEWFSKQMGVGRKLFLRYLHFRKPDSR